MYKHKLIIDNIKVYPSKKYLPKNIYGDIISYPLKINIELVLIPFAKLGIQNGISLYLK